jgi:hypothetical protein
MKTTYQDKYKKLEKEVSDKIRGIILTKGEVSEFTSDYVLKVKDEHSFSLDGGRDLAEITATELIDNSGYKYSLTSIGLDQLCEIVDSF